MDTVPTVFYVAFTVFSFVKYRNTSIGATRSIRLHRGIHERVGRDVDVSLSALWQALKIVIKRAIFLHHYDEVVDGYLIAVRIAWTECQCRMLPGAKATCVAMFSSSGQLRHSTVSLIDLDSSVLIGCGPTSSEGEWG